MGTGRPGWGIGSRGRGAATGERVTRPDEGKGRGASRRDAGAPGPTRPTSLTRRPLSGGARGALVGGQGAGEGLTGWRGGSRAPGVRGGAGGCGGAGGGGRDPWRGTGGRPMGRHRGEARRPACRGPPGARRPPLAGAGPSPRPVRARPGRAHHPDRGVDEGASRGASRTTSRAWPPPAHGHEASTAIRWRHRSRYLGGIWGLASRRHSRSRHDGLHRFQQRMLLSLCTPGNSSLRT